RRSNKSAVIDGGEGRTVIAGTSMDTLADSRFLPETYISLIPSDSRAIDSITKERDVAYYQLGLIYKEKFKVYELAIDRLEKLLTFEPEERLEVPSKYHLYKTYEILGDNTKMQFYRNDIVTNHPESRYAEILNN